MFLRLPRRLTIMAMAVSTLLLAPGLARADQSDVILDMENGYFSTGWKADHREDDSPFNGGAAFSEALGGEQGLSQDVTGYRGRYWGDSYVTYAADEPEGYKGDRATGNLTSPDLTVTRPYLNLLIGGGERPHEPGASIYPPRGDVFADFSDWKPTGWTGTGSFADIRTSTNFLAGQLGNRLDSCVGRCDAETGTVTSPSFTIDHDWISMLVAGGHHPLGSSGATAVRLVVNGQTVASTTGENSGEMDWSSWDVSAYRGQSGKIELVDQNTSADWGHLAIGQITFGDERQAPWSHETAVNVLVDGEVVASVTGNNSPRLEPASIDLRSYLGRTIRIQAVDQAVSGPWAHFMFDHLEFSDTRAG